MNTQRTFSARELATMAVGEPERDEDGMLGCAACRKAYTLPPELEPTTFCNLCAQGAVVQIAAELVRLYDAIERMPPFLAAPLMETLTLGTDKVAAFMKDAIFAQAKRSPTGRGAKKKR